jgi:hypothetical protein
MGENRAKNSGKLRRIAEQAAVIDTLMTRPAWAASLLAEMKKGKIPRKAVSPFHARQVLAMEDKEVTLGRSFLAEITRLPDSMMPPGLLETPSTEQTRDLIAYPIHPQQVALLDEKNETPSIPLNDSILLFCRRS